jgi:hypothetical protein
VVLSPSRASDSPEHLWIETLKLERGELVVACLVKGLARSGDIRTSASWDGSKAKFSWLAREGRGDIKREIHTQRVSCYIGGACGRERIELFPA